MAQNVVINGVTYSSVPEVDIPKSGGGTAKFFDTAAAYAIGPDDVIYNAVYFDDTGEHVGEMPNNGSTSGTISTKAGSVSIPAGYTSGGSVTISSTEQAKIIAANIKSGVTLLGVAGSLSAPTISQDNTTHVLSIS